MHHARRSRLLAPALLALLAAALCVACSNSLGHDIDCLDDPFNNSDECVHDAQVSVLGLQPHVGRRMFVRAKSSGSGRDEQESLVITSDTVSLVFADFIREGGGPYELRVFVDLDEDGRCDDPPADAVWQRRDIDDDDVSWVLGAAGEMDTCR